MTNILDRVRKMAGLPLMEEHDESDVTTADFPVDDAPEEFTVAPEDMVSDSELTSLTGFTKEALDEFRDAALALNAKTAKHKKATGHEELVDLHAQLRTSLSSALDIVNHLEAFVEPSEDKSED